MKEAKIECLLREFPIHDLGLTMRQGQVEFVGAEVARGSVDLAAAKRIGAVRVVYVVRARMIRKPAPPRPPPPPNVRLPRRRTFPAPAEPTGPPAGNIDEIKAAAAEAARDATREAVAELREALQEALANRPVFPPGFPAVVGPQTPVGPAPAPEPVFIPDNIVNKAADIKVSSGSADAGDMDAAAASLRTRRGPKAKPKAEE